MKYYNIPKDNLNKLAGFEWSDYVDYNKFLKAVGDNVIAFEADKEYLVFPTVWGEYETLLLEEIEPEEYAVHKYTKYDIGSLKELKKFYMYQIENLLADGEYFLEDTINRYKWKVILLDGFINWLE